jgi:hypothetical protein
MKFTLAIVALLSVVDAITINQVNTDQIEQIAK